MFEELVQKHCRDKCVCLKMLPKSHMTHTWNQFFYHFRFLIKADFKSFIFSYTQIKHGELCMLTASALFPIMSRGSLTD